jgi:cation:H+ antiporter
MLLALLWSALGLAALIAGAELMVRSGTALAARIGVSPLLIGLTIVAIGTSAPELAIGIDSALQGNGALAVGNIAGTNTVNILLILGLSAALRPLAIRQQTLRLDLPIMVLAAAAMLALSWDGVLTRMDGVVLVGLGVFYTYALVVAGRRQSKRVKAEFAQEFGRRRFLSRKNAVELAVLLAGIVVIVVGAEWLVDGAVELARLWGVSDAFIGLTVVAIGTSAPELVTTVVSTIRNERDMAIGNLIGSSVYNICVILGITCLVPAAGIEVGPNLIRVDIPVMLLVAALCIPVFVSGRKVSRLEGTLFVAAYCAYLAYLIVFQT